MIDFCVIQLLSGISLFPPNPGQHVNDKSKWFTLQMHRAPHIYTPRQCKHTLPLFDRLEM